MNPLQPLLSVYDRREARAIYSLVMEKAFGLSQTDVLLGKDKELSAHSTVLLQNIIRRIAEGEPVQYVLGQADFCGHEFHVRPGVLIPRPETEQLVRLIAEENTAPKRILDIGTGSGCIAVSLALRGHDVTAFDISEEALSVASENAQRLGTEAEFIKEDILHPSSLSRQWDIIVSNPPYICQSEASQMEANVLDHEPHLALFVPDTDPLLFYRAIVRYATEHLADGGRLYFECNREYVHNTCILLNNNSFSDIEPIMDLYGNPRFVKGVLSQTQTSSTGNFKEDRP